MIIKESLKYCESFIDNSNDYRKFVKAALGERHQWLAQSIEEFNNVTCTFREHANNYGLAV